jgi:lipopolysaccharide transport system ATP-binding protein
MSSKKAVITARGLSKSYKVYKTSNARLRELLFGLQSHDYVAALRPTDLEVFEGEVLGIMGRNGAGKSTLMQLIAGTLTPSTGTVEVAGRITALLELGSGFNTDFSGRENVFLYGSILGLTRSQVSSKLSEILEFADLGKFVDMPVRTYSSGMTVRLAFSTIVGLDPEVILVDEALAVGDANFQVKCMRLIYDLKRRGKTFVLASHSIPQVVSFCTRAIVIEGGAVIFDGDPKEAGHVYKSLMLQGSTAQSPAEAADVAEATKAAEAAEQEMVDTPMQAAPPVVKTKSEYRFGNGVARIDRIEMRGQDDTPSQIFFSGNSARVLLHVSTVGAVQHPVYGVRVRTKEGLDVYVKNTLSEKVQPQPLRANTSTLVEIEIRLGLCGGDYFLSAGLSDQRGSDIVPIDRRIDMFGFTIITGDTGAGIADLAARFVYDT